MPTGEADIFLAAPTAGIRALGNANFTVLRAVSGGFGGNSITMTFVADGSGAGSLTLAGTDYTFHFQDGVTTSANFERAVNALSGASRLIEVQDSDPGGFPLSAGIDEFGPVNFSGGEDSTGTVVTPPGNNANLNRTFVPLTCDATGESNWLEFYLSRNADNGVEVQLDGSAAKL